MSRKALILSTGSINTLDKNKLKDYVDYGNKHNLDICGEIHCSPFMFFVTPKEIVDMIMEEKPEVIIADDPDIIIADICQNGELLKMFKNEGATVVNTELDHDIQDFNKLLDEDMKRDIKETVNHVIGQLLYEEKNNVAIMTNDSSREELMSFVKKVSLESEQTCIIEIPEFNPQMSKHIDFCIKDSDINKIIIYDRELLTSSMKEYLFKLQTECNIDIGFKEEYDMNVEETLRFNGMGLN